MKNFGKVASEWKFQKKEDSTNQLFIVK